MKQILHIVWIAFLLIAPAMDLAAQDRSQIDSLKKIVARKTDDSLKAKALTELSLIYRQLGDPDSAIIFAEQSLQVAKNAGYRKGEGKALYYMGIVYAIRGNYPKAEKYYEDAEAVFQSIGDLKNYSSVLTAHGGLLQYKGDPNGALELHMKSLKIKREIGDSLTAAAVTTNIGTVYSVLGEYDKALDYFMQSYQIHIRAKEVYKLTDDCCNIGNMYHQLKQDSLAMVYLNRSMALADSLELVEIQTYSYAVVAGIYYDNHQYDSAEYYYNKALAVAESIDDKRMMSYQYLNLGSVYHSTGREAMAEEAMKRSLELAEEIDAVENLRDIHLQMNQFYREQENFKDALFHYEKYIFYRDSLLDAEKQTDFARKEMTLEFENERALKQAEQDKIDAIGAEEKKRQKFFITLVTVALILVLVFVLFLYNRFVVVRKQNSVIQQQKTEVEHQKEIIEEKNKSITDSITYAQRIQHAILPDSAVITALFPESFIFHRPKDIVSGDFYWIAESDGYVFYVTADCTGHGVPGGFMSVLGASLLNEIVGEKNVTSPGKILDLMREKIIHALRQKGEMGENKDGMDMILCRMDKQSRKLCFAAANNPVWLLRKGEITEYKGDKQPVGIGVENPVPFTEHEVDILPGDVIYTLTDGYADQFGGTKGKKYKYRALQELLISVSDLSMDHQRARIETAFDEWRGNLEQVDDVLVIGIRI